MSEESAIVAAPVQDFEGAFQARVVRDASTSPASQCSRAAVPTG